MVFKKGYKPTEEQRKKQSETRKRLIKEGKIDMKKRMQNPEIRKKISKTLKGKKHTKKRRENISQAVKKSYEKGRVKNHFNKVSNAEITERVMFNGKRIPISHKVWFENTGHMPKKGEIVHHIDFDKYNNDFYNLKLMTISEHMKLHWEIEHGNN